VQEKDRKNNRVKEPREEERARERGGEKKTNNNAQGEMGKFFLTGKKNCLQKRS
jgi:hypothetical protein